MQATSRLPRQCGTQGSSWQFGLACAAMGGRGERIRVLTLAVAVGLVLVLGACKPLREYPASQSLFLGSAARANLLAEPNATTLSREFNGLVPENELKWETFTRSRPRTTSHRPTHS